jgi:predicted MFS family arabinose efflux permease
LPDRILSKRIAAGLFAGLGLQVGVWAVLIPHLVATRDLTPAELGALLALLSAAAIGTLAASGPLADRIGRRRVVVAGSGAFAAAFALLAWVESAAALWPTIALFGVAAGLFDLGANAIGADYERAYQERAMIQLHAGFSAAAAAGALLAGAIGADMYVIAAGLYAALAVVAAVVPLPPHEDDGSHEAAGGRLELLRMPAIALAVAMCTLCFFGDGAIEGYAALFLRDVLASSGFLAGVGLAAFHSASLVGRLLFSRVVDERRTMTVAALLASAGMVVTVVAQAPAVAAVGLLIVGFALAPIVPTTLSLAGRSAPGRSATAVSLVTTIGYSAFVAGPPIVGALASVTSLRTALAPVIVSTAAIALLARFAPLARGR